MVTICVFFEVRMKYFYVLLRRILYLKMPGPLMRGFGVHSGTATDCPSTEIFPCQYNFYFKGDVVRTISGQGEEPLWQSDYLMTKETLCFALHSVLVRSVSEWQVRSLLKLILFWRQFQACARAHHCTRVHGTVTNRRSDKLALPYLAPAKHLQIAAQNVTRRFAVLFRV